MKYIVKNRGWRILMSMDCILWREQVAFFNVVLYEIYSKKSKVMNTYVHGLYHTRSEHLTIT